MNRLGFLVLAVAALCALAPVRAADVTTPDDNIIGVPNNGNWPGSEGPPLAINNDVGTKFLHFSGATVASGFRVTPPMRQTIVGGMTFTTANDAPDRDPMTFELYGSNVSIDGPYILIASGSTFLPDARFAGNTSPIEFTPGGAFDHYQVLFPAIRNVGAGMMQIAEVELLEGFLPVYSLAPGHTFERICPDTKISWAVDPSVGNPAFTVYFGADPNVILNASVSNVTATELDPAAILGAPLGYDTAYYWSVNIDIGPNDPNNYVGPTWTFTTASVKPVLTQEPEDVVSEAGATTGFTFNAEVVCDPQQAISYQWYYEPNDVAPAVLLVDGDGISGTASDTLVLQNLTAADAGLYFCVATGNAGSVESRHASLQLMELLGHWPLDGDCTDISGYNNDGIARGAAFGFEPGIIGQAANFNNLGLFEIPNPAHFDQANAMITVYCWVKSVGTGDWEPFVAKFGESNVGWQLRKRGSSAIHTLTLRGTTGTDDPTPATSANLFDRRWHQVVGTYDGATRRIYMDGREIMSLGDTGVIASTPVAVSIGGRIRDNGAIENFVNGMVDDVRIYKGAMPAKLVAQLYSNATGVEICSPALPGDISGPMGLPDCVVDMYDLAAFAANWLLCQNIDVTKCL